jgi:hypothetical protein
MSEKKIQKELLEIWQMSNKLQKRVDDLSRIRGVFTAAQRMAIESAQNGIRGWRGINLGELLNAFDIPPEKRK